MHRRRNQDYQNWFGKLPARTLWRSIGRPDPIESFAMPPSPKANSVKPLGTRYARLRRALLKECQRRTVPCSFSEHARTVVPIVILGLLDWVSASLIEVRIAAQGRNGKSYSRRAQRANKVQLQLDWKLFPAIVTGAATGVGDSAWPAVTTPRLERRLCIQVSIHEIYRRGWPGIASTSSCPLIAVAGKRSWSLKAFARAASSISMAS